MASVRPSPSSEPSGWWLLESGPGDPAWNMAVDEALLIWAHRLGQPVLRFYAWSSPAATFGYFQPYAEVAEMTSLRPLIRRPTGGGLVPHEDDWTYSLVFPPSHPWHRLRARESYRTLHEWVQAALARVNVSAELALTRRKELPGQCFAGAEQFDVVSRGCKIAGAAQRRNRAGLLIQGSVQPPPPGVARADWEQAMCDAATAAWGVQWHRAALPEPVAQCARELVRAKYASRAYNERR